MDAVAQLERIALAPVMKPTALYSGNMGPRRRRSRMRAAWRCTVSAMALSRCMVAYGVLGA